MSKFFSAPNLIAAADFGSSRESAAASESSAVPAPGLHIEHLSLRLSGGNRESARRIAEQVARRLGERLPKGVSGDLGRIELNVRPHGKSEECVTEAIVSSLLRALPRPVRSSSTVPGTPRAVSTAVANLAAASSSGPAKRSSPLDLMNNTGAKRRA